MANLDSLAPHEFFEIVADSIKNSQDVDTFDQDGRFTTITCDTTNLIDRNYVDLDCGNLSGEYQIYRRTETSITIEYSGVCEAGTMKTYPFFDWGNLKEGKVEIYKRHEYPLIFMILPDKYNVDLDETKPYYINDNTFKFFVVKRFRKDMLASEKTNSEYIFKNYVKDCMQIADEFSLAVRNSEYFIKSSFSYSRSEEIPFGVTFGSNENGKSEALFEPKSAGCYIEISVDIRKQYNC